MADDGIVEKILTTKTKSSGGQSRSQGLRLRDPDELHVKGEEDDSAVAQHRDIIEEVEEEEDDNDDDGSYPSAMRSIERQILDLLMNAGSRGVTNYEISATLGNFSLRFIDAILQKLGRTALPPALADYSIHSLHETIGRLKQTRWFSLVGYLSYRRERGFPDEDAEALWTAIEESGRLGQWEDDEGAGPREGQYATAAERQKRLASFNMWASVGDPAAGTSGGKSGGGKQRKKSTAAAKGKAKEVKQDSPADAFEDGVEARKGPAEKKRDGPARSTGRPRKHPLAPGEESTYMRKKREKAEDEERERLGLPPLERPKPPRKNARQPGPRRRRDKAASGSQAQAGEASPSEGMNGAAKDGQSQDVDQLDSAGPGTPSTAETTGGVVRCDAPYFGTNTFETDTLENRTTTQARPSQSCLPRRPSPRSVVARLRNKFRQQQRRRATLAKNRKPRPSRVHRRLFPPPNEVSSPPTRTRRLHLRARRPPSDPRVPLSPTSTSIFLCHRTSVLKRRRRPFSLPGSRLPAQVRLERSLAHRSPDPRDRLKSRLDRTRTLPLRCPAPRGLRRRSPRARQQPPRLLRLHPPVRPLSPPLSASASVRPARRSSTRST